MTAERNYGIDLLRIISMLFIVVLHTLTHGGVADAVSGNINDYPITLLLTIVWTGVDIFAIISGFVGVNHQSNHRISEFVFLWIRVAFYSGVITLIASFLGEEEMSQFNLIKWFAPISNGSYWYFTSYLFVFLVGPAINKYVKNSNASRVTLGLLVGLFLLYLSHTITGIFSPALLLYLYFIGCVIGKYRLHERVCPKFLWCTLIVLILLTWAWKLLMNSRGFADLWLRYDSPTIIGIAACFVMLFARMKVKPINAISFVTPSVFSVYLINDHKLIRKHLITDRFVHYTSYNPAVLLGIILGFSILFFLCAIMIDIVRRKIESECRIKQMTISIENLVEKVSIMICDFVKSRLKI